MPQRVALVDFDGVVLRNAKAQGFVAQRVEKFVEGQLKFRHPASLQRFNKELYQSYGHTWLGLQDMGLTSSLEEFNHAIYSQVDPQLELSRMEKAQWDVFYHTMRSWRIPIYLFSNADPSWCAHFLCPRTYVYGFVQEVCGELPLKPHPQVYHALDAHFPASEFLYWEDKWRNFQPCLHNPRWTSVWVNPDASRVQSLAPRAWMVPSLDVLPPI